MMNPGRLQENTAHLLFLLSFFSSGTNSACVKVGMISNITKCSQDAPLSQPT